MFERINKELIKVPRTPTDRGPRIEQLTQQPRPGTSQAATAQRNKGTPKGTRHYEARTANRAENTSRPPRETRHYEAFTANLVRFFGISH